MAHINPHWAYTGHRSSHSVLDKLNKYMKVCVKILARGTLTLCLDEDMSEEEVDVAARQVVGAAKLCSLGVF